MDSHFSSEHVGIQECLHRRRATPDRQHLFSSSQKYKQRKTIEQKEQFLPEQHKTFGKEARVYGTFCQNCRPPGVVETQQDSKPYRSWLTETPRKARGNLKKVWVYESKGEREHQEVRHCENNSQCSMTPCKLSVYINF